MKYLTTKTLTDLQKQEIITLWNAEFVTTIRMAGLEDFEKFLSGLTQHQHLLMLNKRGVIKGWFFTFDREGQRWFAMIVSAELQGKGYGSLLIQKGKEGHSELNGWVVDSLDYKIENGTTYRPPLDFYQKNGFEIMPEVVQETPRLRTIKIRWSRITGKD